MSVKIVRGRGVSAVPADLIKGGAVHLARGVKGFDGIGFRLVYDNSERSCRGGDSRDTPLLAQDPGVYWYRPSLRGVGLGFRLVREGT